MAETIKPSEDFSTHKNFYEDFLRLTLIVIFMLLSHAVGLAIGGTAHMWFTAVLGIGASIVAAIAGAAIKGLDWKPGAVVLALLLLVLLMANG
ncbi:hypothetical protein ACMDCR_01980 [Labrys okinawensis]|uniref:hypothetical protein n=1 Tax=Labrys okinawensis TaxID=346911 RepID=UPI0039BD3CCB